MPMDSLNPKGYVILRLYDKDGNTISYRKSNQIVYVGRHHLSRLVCGGTILAGQETINTLKVSDGAVVGEDHLNPTPVDKTDGGLFQTDPLKIKSVPLSTPVFNAISETTVPTAVYSITITSEQIDSIINEMGLFFGEEGPMYAHYSFPTLDLRAVTNNSLEITWELKF